MTLHVLQYSDVENAFDEPHRVAALAGEIDALRESLRAEGERVLVVGTGDVFGPGVLALETDGAHAMDFFEAVSPVAETLGNHDFDHGADRARELVADAPQEFLVANVYERESEDTPQQRGDRQSDTGEPATTESQTTGPATGERFAADATAPSTVVDADGVRVGFVGVASPDTATMAPGATSLSFTDPIPAVRAELDALRDRDVDHTVVLGHLGDDHGEDLAATVDVDLVLDGHRHQPYAATFDGTGYARPGNGARHVVHATLDPGAGDGRSPPSRASGDASDRQLTVDASDLAIDVVETDTGAIHDGLRDALDARFDRLGLRDVVATVTDPIDCSKAATDRGESRVGNLVTDAYRWAADADVAVMSPGGIRTRDPLAGDVTRADLVGLVPFDNDLLTCVVDGQTLRAVLAETTLAHHLEDPTRKFGHYAGVDVVWNDATAAFESITVGGEPLDADASYRLAATDYFVDTDHIYPSIHPEYVTDRHGLQYEAVVAYARHVTDRSDGEEATLDPRIEGRIERPALADADPRP